LAEIDFKNGLIGYNPVFVTQQFLIQQELLYAQAKGDIALGLITVYRAIGGGWEYRLQGRAPEAQAVDAAPGCHAVAATPRAPVDAGPALLAPAAAVLGIPEAMPTAK